MVNLLTVDVRDLSALNARLLFDGHRRLYPHDAHMVVRQAIGEYRLVAALACVDEDGERIAPWPDVRDVTEATAYQRTLAARRRMVRDVVGVA